PGGYGSRRSPPARQRPALPGLCCRGAGRGSETGTSHAWSQGQRAAMLQRCNGNNRGVLPIQTGSFRTRRRPGGGAQPRARSVRSPPSPSPEDSMSRPLAVLLAATLLASGAAPLAAGAPARLRREQAEARVIGRVVDAGTPAPLVVVTVCGGGTEIAVLMNVV